VNPAPVPVGFYHCTRSRPFDVVPVLAGKAIEAGHRVLVHSADGGELDALDSHLWTYDPSSFLPHGRDNPAMQPVLLSDDFAPANGADLLISVGGKLPGDPAAFARVLYLFDGNDEDSLAAARAHWRALKAREGVQPIYWTQGEKGGWQKAG
jgi:DNA polymerase-3 subunit chi